ncbi:MAG: hypothetical protein MJY98_08985 [Fibrobacter sp.]|nr:hypothetical protein [Fibrobacter sp.]
MKRLLVISFAIVAMLVACGDSSLVSEQNISHLEQQVLVTHGGGTPAPQHAVGDSIFLEKNQTYTFYAGHLIDGNLQVSSENSFYSSILWDIDGQYYNIKSISLSFEEAGAKQGFLETVDYLGDTLRTPFTILVNEPSGISLTVPYNGYNQVERDNAGVQLKWNITGVDPWESSICTVYASDDPDSVWTNAIGNVDCFKGTTIGGVVDTASISNTIYWGVSLYVKNSSGKTYTSASKVFHFSTKIPESDFSYLTIPFNYNQLSRDRQVQTEIQIVAPSGDTLHTVSNTNRTGEITVPLAPQSGIIIYATEKVQSEYKTKSDTIDIPKNTLVQLDTLQFFDKVPPQAAPSDSAYAYGDLIYFYAYDDGAGVSRSKLHVIMGRDTLTHVYEEPYLIFEAPCKHSCELQIVGEDNARNPFPKQHWRLEHVQDFLYIKGPYPGEAK